MQKTPLILALLAGLALSGAAQAALNDRGGGLIYDDVLNLTWLQDANYAKTSGYSATGKMNWDHANAWAAGLVYHDSVRNVDYSDWRLPTMLDTGAPGCDLFATSGTDCGYSVQTYDSGTGTVYSELATMYHVNLGLKSASSPTGDYQPDFGIFGNGTCDGVDCISFGQNDVGLIVNLQAYAYWSGLEYAPDTDYAWYFDTAYGGQGAYPKDFDHYAWAVRSGDVATVPEADTWAMLLAGLGLVGVATRRRRG